MKAAFSLFLSKGPKKENLYVGKKESQSAILQEEVLGEYTLSTDESICPNCGLPLDLCVCQTIAQEEARITVSVERRKWGRLTTIIEGFDKNTDLGQIATKLKSKLACGGAAKEGHVELQGDHRRVIKDILSGLGFPDSAIVVDWAASFSPQRH